MSMKKRTALLLFLSTPQGQKMLKDTFNKLDTPRNRERLSEFSKQLKERAGAAKEKHAPAVKEAFEKAKGFKLNDVSKGAKGEGASAEIGRASCRERVF